MSAEENDPMVKNAIGFLKHPKVVSSGVAEKVAFLKKKGLTNQQIANAYIAIDKDSKEAADILEGKYDSATVPQSSASTPVTPAVAQPLQNQMNLPVNSQQYSGNQSTSIWTKLAYVFGGAALFGASGAAGFLAMKNYQDQFIANKKDSERDEGISYTEHKQQLREELLGTLLEEQRKELKDSLTGLRSNIKDIMSLLNEQGNVQKALNTAVKSLAQSQKELQLQPQLDEPKNSLSDQKNKENASEDKSEAVEVKVLSETAKETDIVSNVVEETIISNSADSSDSLTTDSVVSRIQDLVNSNEEPKAQKALAFLRMILGKIVNNPKEPQLKKISTSNKIYSDRLRGVNGSIDVLESLGFENTEGAWELKSVDLDRLQVALDTIKPLLKSQS